ncbi:MAG TPA: hypothetical protein VHF92_11225 [Geodermatophilus sp.]|nr:hypothetical protein [Geodermatophilus sp.]
MAGYFRVTLGSDGFTGATLPNLISWSFLVTFAVAAAAAAWRRRSAC